MKTVDRIALLLSITAFFAAAFVSRQIYEGIPHIEDEITYVWQARLAATGNLVTPTPVCPSCFLQPFVVDLDGVRFGKYPPGWPAMLSLGIRFGLRGLVNPLLAAFYVWLNYLLVKKLFDPQTGLLATVLTILSPFFLMNSGTLLAHSWSLLLAVIFAHAWLDALQYESRVPKWMVWTAAIFALGLLVLTRPLTAVGVGIPFFVHGLYTLITGSRQQRTTILIMGAGVAALSGLYLLWQYRVTGDFLQNPYVLYWSYDRIGFGSEIGLHPDGHQLKYAWINTKFSLKVGMSDLFGWPRLSWLFLPFGLVAILKNRHALLIASVFFSLVIAYGFYWIGSWLFGPRYYFEGLFSLTLLTAAGIRWLAGNLLEVSTNRVFSRFRFVITYTFTILLILGNLFYFLPIRLGGQKGLYGMSSSQLLPFHSEAAQLLTPALVIVKPEHYWLEYGVLLELSSPQLNSPFIFSYDRGREMNAKIIEAFPERNVIYYSPAEPYTFSVLSK